MSIKLHPTEIDIIRRSVTELAGQVADIVLFNPHSANAARGGDINLLVEVPYPVDEPALLRKRVSGRVGHRLGGKKVDVVLSAPNLQRLPLHNMAKAEGVTL